MSSQQLSTCNMCGQRHEIALMCITQGNCWTMPWSEAALRQIIREEIAAATPPTARQDEQEGT